MPPLPFPMHRPACPIDALPEPCRSAALYAIAEKRVPAALALTDAIGAAAAIVHTGYDCEAPDGDRIPATINTCVVAPSRSGKWTSMKVFFRLFLDTQTRSGSAPGVAEHKSDGRALTAEITKFVSRTITYAGLVETLAGQGKNLTIQREEGESFLKSDLFKDDADALTQLWSGGPFDHTTRGKTIEALDARCSVGFRIQPVFMEDYLKKHPLSYKLGFWPRAIAGCHDPTRYPGNSTFEVPNGAACSPVRFQRRMEQIARRLHRRRSGARTLIKLSVEARAFMLELDHVLRGWDGKHYIHIPEAVGSAWDNTLRVATVLHVFCIGRGQVTRELVERAWRIVEWSLSQHQLIFAASHMAQVPPQAPNASDWGPPAKPPSLPRQPRLPRPLENATWVLECLHRLLDSNQSLAMPAHYVQGFSGLNDKDFRTALDWLLLEKKAKVFMDGGQIYLHDPTR